MERIKVAIIGGGAAGLFLANALSNTEGVTLFERGERLGRKLSATGNGQGNLTNHAVCGAEYFSVGGGQERAAALISAFDNTSLTDFFAARGVLCAADERGRVYPSSRQASALTDALRFGLEEKGISVRLQTQVASLEKGKGGFWLTLSQSGERVFAEKVVLCTGGKAAKNFGTDGSAYALATGLGHSVTPLYPSLVQLKTDTAHIKTLKGIRINGGVIRAVTPTRSLSVRGDIIFTDYGISGDGVFGLSAFLAAEIPTGECKLRLDFLPAFTREEIYRAMAEKRAAFPNLPVGELLFGVVNNQVGRAVMKMANGDLKRAAELVKAFPLTVTGSLGFDYAQVTKGGIPLAEVTKELESKFAAGLYFAGEMLDIDGQCGGFNLQWAYSSARTVAQAIDEGRGQVCE